MAALLKRAAVVLSLLLLGSPHLFAQAGLTYYSGGGTQKTWSFTAVPTLVGAVPDGSYIVGFTKVNGAPSYVSANMNATIVVTGGVVEYVVSGSGAIVWGGDIASGMPIYSGQVISATINGHAFPSGSTVTIASTASPWTIMRTDSGGISPGGGVVNQNMTFTLTGTVTDYAAVFAIPISGDCADNVTLLVNGVAATVELSGDGESVLGYKVGNHTGHTYEWQVSGITVASGTVAAYSFEPGGSPEFPAGYYLSENTGPGGLECPAPPTPTPTPTPTATPTPTPAPSATPYATAPPGSTPGLYSVPSAPGQAGGTGSGAVILNASEIYSPIVAALSGPVPGAIAPEPSAVNEFESDEHDRGHLDELVALNAANIVAIEEGIDSGVLNLSQVTTPISGWSNASFGSVSTLPIPLNLIAPAWPSSLSIPSWVALLRTLILWFLTACWWVVAIRSILAQSP